MTSLLHARRRAEEFAAAVDRAPAAGSTLPAQESPLLAVVSALRSQEPVTPRADFAADLRSRLMTEAQTTLTPADARLVLPPRRRGPRERRLAAAASAFVLIGGSTTMAAAAQSALPGDPLYPIKRGIERAEAGLSMNDAGKGQDLLDQAAHRLTEVEALLVSDQAQDAVVVSETLTEFSRSAQEGSVLLFASYRESGDPEPVVAVREFTTDGIAALEQVAPLVPAEAQDELADAAILLHQIDEQAAALCSACATQLPLVQVPGIFLARAEVDQAMARAAALDLLNDHPVVVTKDLLSQSSPAPQLPAAPAQPDSGGDTDSSPAPAPEPIPSPTLEAEAWPSLLPEVEDKTSGGTTSGGTTGESLGDVEKGLGGAIETLLPDTDGLLP